MKLVFLQSDFPPLPLRRGIHRIGSEHWADIRLGSADVLPLHAELYVGAKQASLGATANAPVQVNEQTIDGMTRLQHGDVLQIGQMRLRFEQADASQDAADAPAPAVLPQALRVPATEYFKDRLPGDAPPEPPSQPSPSPAPEPSQVPRTPAPMGATQIHQALPKYVLRGISSTNLGWTLPLPGATVVGRSADCGIQLEHGGLSREHARLTPTAQGLLVEDMDSSNGTFLNEQKISRAVAHHGDEIGLDVLRFRLVATAVNDSDPMAHARVPQRSQAASRNAGDASAWPWMLGAVLLLVLVLLVLLFW